MDTEITEKETMEWIDYPLWDTEIIPTKGIKRLHLFTTPIGQSFQHNRDEIKSYHYSNQVAASQLGYPNEFKLKKFAIGLLGNADENDEKIIINDATLSFITGMDRIRNQIALQDMRIFKQIGGYHLHVLTGKCQDENILYHIRSMETYRVEIDWAYEIKVSVPIMFSVFLLGLYGRLKEI